MTRTGPSDPQAEQGGREAREEPKRTYGGVNYNKPKEELVKDAEEAGIDVKSSWTKHDLAEALQKEYDRQTAQARS